MDPVESVSDDRQTEQSIDTDDAVQNEPESLEPGENVADENRAESPVISVEPHLESNLNVIENQNNENLERDQELRAEILNSGNVEEAVDAVESSNTIDESLQETADEQNVDNDIENNEHIDTESISDTKESYDDVSEPKDSDDVSEPKESTDEVTEPKECNDDVIEPKEDNDDVIEPKEDNGDVIEREEGNDDVRESAELSEDVTEHTSENTQEEEAEHTSDNTQEEEPNEKLVENEQDTSESNAGNTVHTQRGDPAVISEATTNYYNEDEKTETEGMRPASSTEAEVTPDEKIPSPGSKEDEQSNEGKLSEDQKTEEEPTYTVGEVCADVESTSKALTRGTETTDSSISLEKEADVEEKSAENIDVEKDTAAARDEVLLDTSSKSNDNGDNNKNIEFAQVDFETDETEKAPEEPEKESDALHKSVELDPIASEMIADEFEPAEDREGADEELCIIPDTEREISQAEKDAASSLPPLKDISEASTVASTSGQEPDVAETTDLIRVFNHDKDGLQQCCECQLKRKVKFEFTDSDEKINYVCDKNCLDSFKKNSDKDVVLASEESGGLRVKNFVQNSNEPPSLSFIRKCSSCKKIADDVENNLTWEIMDFCNEFCLSKYQREIGSKCSSCTGDVKSSSLGKYCVRFGNDIRQFCSSSCLEQYKKGLKVCSYCQQDMSSGPKGFLAPVGEKGQFKDFCSKLCMEKYDIMTNDRPPKVDRGTLCSVCKTEKLITIEFELDGANNYFCGEPCFVAFSFVNNISPGKCAMCRRHFNKCVLEKHTMYYDNVQYSFCSNSCENIYIIAHRKIVPCSWCKVKKYNFDMIKKYSKSGLVVNMCSINCLSLYQVSLNAVHSKRITCNYCQKMAHPMYHLTMSDATIRNFCSYACVMSFQNQFPKQPITLNNLGDSNFPVPTGAPKRNKKYVPSPNDNGPVITDSAALPVIANVQSLASSNTNGLSTTIVNPPGLSPITTSRLTRSAKATSPAPTPTPITSYSELPVQIQLKQHFIVRPMQQPEQRNVATMCSVRKAVKGVQAKPTMADMGIQTEKTIIEKILIPVPVPIYVPTPCHMFCVPVPIPVPFPIPVPIPIFIPTSRNSAAGIMKEIKKIQVKIPTDPYEAELLMMAEMVAEEKKEENTDSESDIDDAGDAGDYSPEPVDTNNTFGDDMLQMALKMATELDEPAVDLEGALTANTITAQQGGHQDASEENVDDPQPMHPHMMERGRKRGMRGGQRGQSKRGRRMSHHQVEIPMMQVQQPPPPPEPQEKPDANMCLKYTFGVNAWKQWVTTKNTELEKSSRRVKLFKTEILQLTADELNYSLCLFVKEVRKPNGQEYAPDTIYYLCLGIQQYLFENGRIDNIFCDPYYEKFTDCLDEVAKKFSVLYNDSHYIVTRVEEEHLWESKQLGAHSPHVLLSTLMFFNTKHFNLTSVDEHMQLSFSHIMKHWKRNPNQPGASKVPGSRNVLLRFYPPQSALQHNQRKKKVYEQQENEENPLRCPVKLYEFYLSKCPESVKTRNDVFYLQPERSCVPDSPVWYSTMPLPKEALEKMLHRVKMVKEINVALLAS